jgi:hypothetical protein
VAWRCPTGWIGIGLLGLPLYGALFFWSSFEGQPDPDTQLRAWSRFVTTDYYVISHLLSNILGSIFLIFGVFALGAYFATSRAGSMGLVAMFLTVLGSTLFLPMQGDRDLRGAKRGAGGLGGLRGAAPHLCRYRANANRPSGHLALLRGQHPRGRSGLALWDTTEVVGSPLGGRARTDVLESQLRADVSPARTPFTVPLGAVVVVISGGWIALSVLSRPSGAPVVGAAVQPRVR